MKKFTFAIAMPCLIAVIAWFTSGHGQRAAGQTLPPLTNEGIGGDDLTDAFRPRAFETQSKPRSTFDKDRGFLVLRQGRIEILDSRKLASPRPGLLAFVEPNIEGAEVEAGQVIVGLKSEVAVAALATTRKRAESDIEERYAKAAQEVAESKLKRTVKANNRYEDAFAPGEVETLQLEEKRARLQIEKAQNDQGLAKLEVKQAEAELETYEIVSEISGEISKVSLRAGSAVSQGEEILQVTQLDYVRGVGHVAVDYFNQIRNGTTVKVRIDFEDRDIEIEKEEFVGKIYFRDVKIDELNKEFDVYVKVANKRNQDGVYILRQGMPIRIEVPIE